MQHKHGKNTGTSRTFKDSRLMKRATPNSWAWEEMLQLSGPESIDIGYWISQDPTQMLLASDVQGGRGVWNWVVGAISNPAGPLGIRMGRKEAIRLRVEGRWGFFSALVSLLPSSPSLPFLPFAPLPSTPSYPKVSPLQCSNGDWGRTGTGTGCLRGGTDRPGQRYPWPRVAVTAWPLSADWHCTSAMRRERQVEKPP